LLVRIYLKYKHLSDGVLCFAHFPAENIKPDKERSTERIDGAVSTIMALDRALRHNGYKGNSVYDGRGLLVL